MTDATPVARMRKARQALSSSRMLLRAGDPEGACNRAYYAMFHAAHAVLELREVVEPDAVIKTHNGLITMFGKLLVQSGEIDEKLGRALSKVHGMRLLADYQGDPPSVADASWAIGQADLFIAALHERFFS